MDARLEDRKELMRETKDLLKGEYIKYALCKGAWNEIKLVAAATVDSSTGAPVGSSLLLPQ